MVYEDIINKESEVGGFVFTSKKWEEERVGPVSKLKSFWSSLIISWRKSPLLLS
jgi:hypothetical protein